MINEQFLPVKGYIFEISNFGRLRNGLTKRILKLNKSKKGYMQYCASLGHRKINKCFSIHRLVAEAFIPNPLNKPQVNHIDSDRTNNKVNNLEWVTAKENMQHALKNNRIKCGIDGINSKFSEIDVKFIRFFYGKVRTMDLTNMFNVSKTQIIRCAKRITYKNID